MEYTQEEQKLLSTRGMCSIHTIRTAEYVCETCGTAFCVSCYLAHIKMSPEHIAYNYKEVAVSSMDAFLRQTPAAQKAQKRACGEEAKLHEAASLIRKALHALEAGVEQSLADFQHAHIDPLKGAVEFSEGKETVDEACRRLKEFEEKADYMGMLVYGRRLRKKNGPPVPFQTLGQQLDKSVDAFLEQYNKTCRSMFGAKIEIKREEETKQQRPAGGEEEEDKNRENLDAGPASSNSDAEDMSLSKESSVTTNPRLPPRPLFCQYREGVDVYVTMEQPSEDETLKELDGIDYSLYKMLYLNSASSISDRTAQMLAAILIAHPALTAFYLRTWSFSRRKNRRRRDNRCRRRDSSKCAQDRKGSDVLSSYDWPVKSR